MAKITVATLKERKQRKTPITMLTSYDYAMARMVDNAGIDMILVGDSLGNVVLGYESTIPVTVDDMIHHAKAVCRGVNQAMVVVDMPFMSYQISVVDALRNAGRIMKESGAQAVKVEGGKEIIEVVRAMVDAGIPVVGHLGLTPQSIHQLGGFKVQGKDMETAQKMIDDAKLLADAGVCALVLECVPEKLAQKITDTIHVPTIGIGAGNVCDGQVLVVNDMLGMYSDFTPKFVKKFADLSKLMQEAIEEYKQEVINREFPAKEHTFTMSDEVLEKLY
ncbi:3-methyl-2-oxobutanoate hydroxymethyltransferase [Anaerosinus gibii]|uniref:3-methyl-2-oxobutanoate hydroxymethyltransferase n=1 Tax=Selenobaculum gibii TaxID=3054208 RepID=A0A9Y2AES2_9FIRM|nr:3-methyl-2-oxobutanoate hydroxymethyltransferase [Selenobaculum gbiensis]WIW70240.1 3-methyl-2-oxobutanoate hydroxymethyltransferase [Selenobaculum gbiensis]